MTAIVSAPEQGFCVSVLEKPRLGTASATHFLALDGMRGLSILMVMFFHFTFFCPVQGVLDLVLVEPFRLGWCGVDVFFVLSGFLITGILLDAKGAPHFFRNFYMRRVLRIFPLYYGVLAVIFLVLLPQIGMSDPNHRILVKDQAWLWSYMANIPTLITGNFEFNRGYFWLNHFWSLAVEEHFYFVWPLVVFLAGRRSLLVITILGILASYSLRVAMVSAGFSGLVTYTFTLCRVDALLWGALVAILARWGFGKNRFKRTAWAIVVAGVVVLLLAFASAKDSLFDAPAMAVAGYSAVDVAVAAAIWLAVTSDGKPWLFRLFSTRFLTTFGKYSYGMYVLHQLLQPLYVRSIEPMENFFHRRSIAVLLEASGGVIVTFLAAVVSWYVWERPFLSLKRFFR